MSYITVLTSVVNVPVAGVVVVDVDAFQGFSSGIAPWGFRLTIDGTVVVDTGTRTATQDIVHFSARKYCAAGSRTITLEWAGDSSITLNAASIGGHSFVNTEAA